MPTAANGDVSLYYETDGAGETVAFVGEAGYGAWLWAWQAPAVAGPRKALVTELRGTGRSTAPEPPYTVDALAADLEAVLADAGARRAHLVGAGLGGMVALRYAREYGRTRSLVLCSAAPSGEAVDEAALRALRAPRDDPAALEASLSGAFTDDFLADGPVERVIAWRRDGDADEAGWRGQLAATLGFEAGPLHELDRPALVLGGTDDPVVPPAVVEALAGELPRGRFEPLAGRHLAFVERARAVNDELLAFLDGPATGSGELRGDGGSDGGGGRCGDGHADRSRNGRRGANADGGSGG